MDVVRRRGQGEIVPATIAITYSVYRKEKPTVTKDTRHEDEETDQLFKYGRTLT